MSPSYWDSERGEESELGMAGPRAKQIAMSEESRKWVESVKEKVRIASGERPKVSMTAAGVREEGGKVGLLPGDGEKGGLLEPPAGLFGQMGKVGSTKRLFRRQV
jgi:hypothetical protein